MEKFLDVTGSPQIRIHPPLQETVSSDSGKNQKRPAPKPPSPKNDTPQRIVAVLSGVCSYETDVKQPNDEDSTVKRISRSTENLLEFITDDVEKNQLSTEGLEEISLLDPPPRRSLSLSQDSLMPCELGDSQTKKKPSRGKFFLHKLLHLGKLKEASKELSPRQKNVAPSVPKPKIEIIHPSDLNGARVEVVPPARTFKSRRTSSSASSSSGEHRESDVLSDSSTSHSVSSSGNESLDQTKKPPPPPRAHSVDVWNAKPARPPPPKSIEILRQMNTSWCNSVETKTDNVYVNLGEARSGLAPNKPMRTGSLREAAADNMKRVVTSATQPEDSDYESFIVSSASPAEDNLYECVQNANHRSSLPECDSLNDCPHSAYSKGKRSPGVRDLTTYRRSEGNADISSDCFKMKFLRSVSLPYCASETESEIYSPYSFYGSELGEEDYEMSTPNHILRMSRLKLKKGRSIVHKNLEDNYGAVVVANHEALAQVVEQMRQGPSIPLPLRALTTAVNLRWTDFAIAKDTVGVVVEKRIFYPALWGTHGVTLCVMAEDGLNCSLHAKGPFNLNPIAELNDLIPASYLPMLKKDNSELIQASISVLTRLQIDMIESYGKSMRSGVHSDESKKEVNFVLLQIINAFKSLQAQGIEEVSKKLTNFVVCREEKDPHPRICITDSSDRSNESRDSLCQCLINVINEILPATDLTPLIANVLQKEKAVSLSQAKGILEFSLWGPADIAFGSSNRERESALQRWLDLERATVLHGLVRTRAELTVFEEWQLLFLVRTSAKIMAEASLLLENGTGEDVSTA
ncbi:hypothetical protein RUM44_000903 [Polyplax serrata]|uniref:Uncharacterized protein n=1 Tax=Polyplax serrata TaxID=468196 RepID=A0ABR1B8Y4_POLSC